MACCKAPSSSFLPSPSKFYHSPPLPSPSLPSLPKPLHSSSLVPTRCRLSSLPFLPSKPHRCYPFQPATTSFPTLHPPIQLLCKAAEYVFPDPVPEFAEAETNKFRTHLLQKLSKKNIFGDSVEEVVRICTEILSNFLHTEYGGPGTLLVIPSIDMADTVNERGLPGGPQAARAAVVWAQKHIDKDWNEWTGGGND